ncbi:MAG: hypothetical protein EA377_12935 [Phycisphaerales bacterium]|nr:MAG: hypothetical protein EA377_12935 [Phycisphaerales bacterium]
MAQAYGMKAASRASKPTHASPPEAPKPTAPSRTPDQVMRTGELVAGTVPGKVAFTPAAGPPTGGGEVLPMYTRAADRVEAAVNIQLGKQIDLKG